jgi:hypothetical protein
MLAYEGTRPFKRALDNSARKPSDRQAWVVPLQSLRSAN